MSDLRASLPTGGGGEISHSIAAAEAGAAHLSVETQLTAHTDIAAARQFFQPASGAGLATPTFTTGAEATAMATKAVTAGAGAGAEASVMTAAAKSLASVATAGAEAAAMGAHALTGVAGAAAGAAEISPMIQLIMRLPGLGGVAQSFFEWLGALFAAPGNLAEVFNPEMWAHLGGSIQASLSNLGSHGLSAEHFNVPLSMLPANAPFLQQLSMQAGHGLQDMHRISSLGANLNNNNFFSGSTNSLQNQFNISGGLDLKKPQFEFPQSGGANSLHLDGKLSGPQLSNNFNSSFLSGTQRLFSDQISQQNSLLAQSSTSGAGGNIVSNASTPAGNAGSSLNISSNNFATTQEVGSMPANYTASDGGIISGPSMSNTNIGYHLSDSAASTLDRAPALSPSGAVSDTLGGKELLASNDVPQGYQPMGGSYFKPQVGGAGDSPATAGDSGLTGLKAEPMSLVKKAPTIGHTPDRGAVDYIGHQSKGAIHAQSAPSPSANQGPNHSAGTPSHTQPAMDQISHRGHHAGTDGKQIASKISGEHLAKPEAQAEIAKPHAEAHAEHHAAKAAHAHRPAASPARPQQVERVSAQAEQQAQAPEQQSSTEQTAMAEPGSDKLSNYTVQRGDNLWDIARKQLGDGSRWSEIYKMNSDVIGSNPDLIHTGLDLKLPGSDATPIAEAGHYTVTPGDNLWDIAKDKLGDGSRWGEIYDANKAIIGENPRMIFSGQDLEIPGAQQAISQAAPAPANVAMAPQVDPSAMAPQAMANPAQQSYFAPSQSAAAPQSNLSGPGAAAAATLDPTQVPAEQQIGPVSPSLAPDLSFLYNNGKSN